MYNQSNELYDLSNQTVTYELAEAGHSYDPFAISPFLADLEIPERTDDEIEAENEIAEIAEQMEIEYRLETYN